MLTQSLQSRSETRLTQSLQSRSETRLTQSLQSRSETRLTQQEALQALLRGEELEFRRQGYDWTKLTNTNLILDNTLEFRIAPRVTMANGVEIPLGYRGKMSMGQSYFLPALHARSCYDSASWDGGDYDTIMMKRGLVFLTKEDAVAYAKAIISLGGGDSEAV